ncbi:MAG: hypothetical protein JST59_02010 [Actinobacteria bacterium]|nr:hypothetical protein [Actinomycetota bacterium]
MKGLLIALVVVLAALAKAPLETPEYTEDLETFKKDKNVIRMQMLAGCWLIVDEYLSTKNPAETVVIDEGNGSVPQTETKESEPTEITRAGIAMVKRCMQKITLKEAVNRVTFLIGKNLTQAKTFQEIVGDFTEEEKAGESSAFDEHIATVLQVVLLVT